MHERILIAGSGGQGILFTGKLLAQSALKTAPFITFFPAYGAEVRGGTCSCQIIFSTEEIGSPIAETFSAILVMNQPSVDRFADKLEDDGIAVLNKSLCELREDKRFIYVPATKIAEKLGSPQSANLVMLGAFLARHPVVPIRAVEAQIAAISSGRKQSLMETNLKAFASGAATAAIKV